MFCFKIRRHREIDPKYPRCTSRIPVASFTNVATTNGKRKQLVKQYATCDIYTCKHEKWNITIAMDNWFHALYFNSKLPVAPIMNPLRQKNNKMHQKNILWIPLQNHLPREFRLRQIHRVHIHLKRQAHNQTMVNKAFAICTLQFYCSQIKFITPNKNCLSLVRVTSPIIVFSSDNQCFKGFFNSNNIDYI